MHLLISFLLLFGSLCRLVSAGPSPQWLYQQIHALPDNGNQHATTELHTKKSEIPPKRKDGVKRLFNFLDSAIQESGSGSGEGSADGRVIMATDQLVSSAGLKGKQSAGVDGHARTKKEKTTNSDSPNVSSYSRSTYGNQRKTTGYSVAGQRAQLYGDAASSRRPPAIPVRSQVSASQGLRTQSLRPQNLIHGAPHRSNIQGPFYTTFTFTFPNSYQDYYRAKGIKSAEPLQENAYGQPQRQRNHFHQQVRALIPGRVPLAQPYNRYPYPASPAGVPGQTRGVIYSRFQYNPHSVAVSRARFPVFPRVVNTPPKAASFSGQVYYRNTIPNQQAGFSRNAQGSFHTYNYPLVQRPQVGRAVISRKPQPQIPMSALMAAGAKSLRQLSHG
ncbi:uncharacterized protein LOC111329704 isoform X2 [Stylophora pistillata]|uniref:uncharacterized protein LOC111329704 isoform X2 n=1 Tax=Stylophora pistillata TaxID=50429 RepID=UPI000C03EEAC|nr:uncharacterized protein LOC111329704 isoform X2 [Stylophora pistillata]